ncbi:uroporphyrinogen decarboxylase [Acidithiobacillus concretivorus]|uniref:Uroporphyrinogen decarboxylase n=1 Tax=Acidithiobacillus concretivorus TaxID=3063952 RepID=A0ABS5ZM09_9PROT|nr:uroporphyrinogen decarboxylase [Acidithiobacillus concretivorus]MBU2737222.1 uroporphyrinogen decarboxylase [Acidithiobacillus concretivorus]
MAYALQNDRFLRACLQQNVDQVPVWLMRQAGRYLPEYRATRARAGDFLTLCTTPELACEVTLQPIDRFPLDAAILFSDILTIPYVMGLGLSFQEGEGPVFEKPLRSAADIARLSQPDPENELRFVMDAVRLIRRELDGRVPLIGFAGSPWTLACYMIEGRGSRDFMHIKSLLYSDPATLHQLLAHLADSVTAYLNAQIAAGAQAVMLFDTWGGSLSTPAYAEFSLAYMTRIIAGLRREADGRAVPVILFTKGGGNWLEAMADSGADVIGLDWGTELHVARQRLGQQVALQGNMDPIALYGSTEGVRQEALRVLESHGAGAGHIFNLGHGITPQTPIENVATLVDTVHSWNPAKQPLQD